MPLPTLLTSSASAQTVLHIAAAADLQPVMPTLAARYQQQSGVKIVASFGSSATLTQQVTNGDPQDVFLSADIDHPQQLVQAKLATDLTPYARGILVLWARKDSPAQPLSIDSLTNPAVTRIAIANDLHAPYGKAAVAALKTLNLYNQIHPKLVVGENIAQTAQFVLTGNAQVGLISMTLAHSDAYRQAGTFVAIPANAYSEIRQSGVVIASSSQKDAARAFLAWLSNPATQSTLPEMGLEPMNAVH